MKRISSIAEFVKYRNSMELKSVGFVPTMGALHEGHRSLVEKSQSQNDITVVSIFVNPKQFNNSNDLLLYPRTLSEDLELLTKQGVDLVFTPDASEMYPSQSSIEISENRDSKYMEGIYRPGHFSGMLLVVLKLFHLVKPKKAYFGEKDYQQLVLVQKMVKELNLDLEVIPCATIRNHKGLALSSRNMRLSEKGREEISKVYSLLKKKLPLQELQKIIEEKGFQVEYLEERWGRRLIAFLYEGIRFIDNVSLSELERGEIQNDSNA